jgi:replicative DNA helicase
MSERQTGYRVLDRILGGGLLGGSLYVIAGACGCGKSAFAQNIASNIARRGLCAAIFSLEMTVDEMGFRLLSAAATVDLTSLRSGRLSKSDFERLASVDRLDNQPWVRSAGRLSVDVIESEVQELVESCGSLGVIAIDSLQLLDLPEDARYEAVLAAAKSFKTIARRLDVPVLLVSQLSPDMPRRLDMRPRLSDLNDGGALEEIADSIIFIYRDEYYNDESDQQGLAEVILAKHRNGPTDMVKLSFLKRYAKFADLAA